MGKPVSLLEDAASFARDFPRDRMPKGYMWDLADYVPQLLDTQLTGRGGWKWGSAALGSDPIGGIYATFKSGDKLLVIRTDGLISNVDLTTGAVTGIGNVGTIVQNPVQIMDFVVVPQASGAAVPTFVDGGSMTVKNFHSSALKGRYAAAYKSRVLLANAVGLEERVMFGPPGFIDNTTPANTGKPDLVPWDSLSYFNSSLPITGLAALRAVVILFHSGSVERIRGAIPPSVSDPLGDMFMEPLFDRAGCGDARSIAYWQDNCIFADERGVHFTDGSIVRNLASQGGILTFWRTLWRNKLSIAADTYLDYYIVTVIRTDGVAVTLLCDLNRRTWFRFTNIKASAYIHSIGPQNKLWGCRSGSGRIADLSNCFFPAFVGVQQDDDGTPVLPLIETPWFRFSEEGRKRIRFGYLSYDVRTTDPLALAMDWRFETKPEGPQQQQLEAVAEEQNGVAATALQKLMEVGYILDPHDAAYTVAGVLPETSRYTRYRLPVNKNPYGLAFRIRQTAASHVTRVYDLGVEQQGDERSRV
jgi:hypothetical protein